MILHSVINFLSFKVYPGSNHADHKHDILKTKTRH